MGNIFGQKDCQNSDGIVKVKELDYPSFITQKGNIVWAGALCLAWTDLRKSFTDNQPIRLCNQTDQIKNALQKLNQAKFTADDINPKSLYLRSGYGQKTVDIINRQVKEKFPNSTIAELKVSLGQDDIISYAYLLKNLPFKVTFQLHNRLKSFNGGKEQFQYFYSETERQKSQIHQCWYENQDNFSVTIDSKEQNQEIYLIKTSKNWQVKDAINFLSQIELKKSEWQILRECDYFEMPVISLDVEREMRQIVNIPIQTEGLKGKVFIKVLQALKLQINQAGAKVQNKAQIVVNEMAVEYESPRQYIFNKDFWVVMRQRKKHPYLAICIKNPKESQK